MAIKSISIFLCLGLLLKPYWPSKFLRYFPVYYHLTLLYCLPFVTTFLFLLEECSIEWIVNVALTLGHLCVINLSGYSTWYCCLFDAAWKFHCCTR